VKKKTDWFGAEDNCDTFGEEGNKSEDEE